jgi:hypothetical protein
MENFCPRCHGPLTKAADQGGASRATEDRDIYICGDCCVDEAVRHTAGHPVLLVAGWPTWEPLMTWDDIVT